MCLQDLKNAMKYTNRIVLNYDFVCLLGKLAKKFGWIPKTRMFRSFNATSLRHNFQNFFQEHNHLVMQKITLLKF